MANDDFTANPTKKIGRAPGAQELPDYQRKTAITPAASPVGFTQASMELGKSYEIFGAMSAKIATNAAQERAQLQGVKAAQENPAIQAGISLNQTDAVFNNSVRIEKNKILANQGALITDKINFEYAKILNPTGKDLESYQQNMSEALGDILSLSDPLHKGDLSRAFEQTMSAGMYQLAARVENANLTKMKDIATNASKNNLTNVVDYYRLGMNKAAEDSYNQERSNIESTRELLGEAVTKTKLDALDLTRDIGIYGGQMMRLQESKGTEAAAKYFRDFVEHIPSGMLPSRHQEVAAELYRMQGNYMRQVGIDQSIQNSKAQLELAANDGILPPDRWEDIRNKVSPEQYNHLLLTSMKAQQASKELMEDMNFVLANGGNVVAMSNLSPDKINKVFDGFMKQMAQYAQETGQEFNPILEGANVAAHIAAPISSYRNMLENAVLFADPEQAAQAGEAIRKLERDNPIALKGLSKDAKDISALFNNYRLNTQYSGAEALQQAKNDIYNVSPEERTRRAAIFAEYMKVNNYEKDPDKWADHVAAGIDAPKSGFIGFRKYMMPSDVPTKARMLMGSYVERFGNVKTAEEEMFKDLNAVYKETNTNNRREKMAYPPNVALKDLNIGEWEDNDKALALYRFVKQNEKLKAKPGSFIFNDISWPENPFDQYMQIDGKPIEFNGDGTMSVDGERITNQQFYDAMPDAITLEKLIKGDTEIMIDGVKRKVIIKSDEITQLSADSMPSWAFAYLDDNGVDQPIMGINQSGGNVRWYPSFGLLDSQKKRIPKWQQDAANLAREQAQNVRDNYLNDIETGGYPKVTSTLYGDDLLSGNPVTPPKKEPKIEFPKKEEKKIEVVEDEDKE